VKVHTRLLIFAAMAIVAGCDSGGICDADELSAALAVAIPGDVVEVGACEVTGAFTVPAAVTLRGASPTGSVIRVSEGQRGLTLITAVGMPTEVESLRVASEGCAAIVADGPGAAILTDLRIDAARGVGVAAQDLASFTLTRVDVAGPIGDEVPLSVPMPPYTCASADPATHGIVVVRTEALQLTEVTTQGFAAYGALLFETDARWTGGGAENNVGTGLQVWGGDAMLQDLRLCRARQGVLVVESYAGLFSEGARIQSTGITVCDSETFGLMHDGVTAVHDDLTATDNAFSAVWAQEGGSLTVGGSAPMLANNGFAGVVSFDVPMVDVGAARIEGTATRTTAAGPVTIRAGDGVHVVGADELHLTGLTLTNNERVGLLLDLGGMDPTAFDVGTVEVSGEGGSLGAVAQNGEIPVGWDADVMRLGATAANDAALTDALEIVGAIGPSCLPDPSELGVSGIDALVGR
jgi:hypothetical protein